MKIKEKYQALKTKFPELIDNLEAIVFGVLITLVIIQFITLGKVDGVSMTDTLQDKDWVIIEKLTYKTRKPKRGEIVAVNSKKYSKPIIKRIVAIGGDQLEIKSTCDIYINDQLIKETYLREPMKQPCQTLNLQLQQDELFLMGDNRNNSLDSRAFGTFNFKSDIIGRAFFRIFPIQRFGSLK